MFVVKASGAREPFDKQKIIRTCIRAGAPKSVAQKIARAVERRAYDGISTREILQAILRELDKYRSSVAARYDLKAAIMRLGPAGFYFERLLGELFRTYGYDVQLDVLVRGYCVTHEIDLILSKKSLIAVEAKYHNMPGIFTGIKDALYVQARYEDLLEGAQRGLCERFDQAQLVTNTKFSAEAIKYAKCKGLGLLGWNYPRRSLQVLLESKSLYPVTTIRGLDPETLSKLASAQLMFCKDLIARPAKEISQITAINQRKVKLLQREALKICRRR